MTKRLQKENLSCYDSKCQECLKDFASREDYNEYCRNCTGTDEEDKQA